MLSNIDKPTLPTSLAGNMAMATPDAGCQDTQESVQLEGRQPAVSLTCFRTDVYHIEQALYTSYSFSERSLIYMEPTICTGLMLARLQDVNAVKG